MKTNRANCPLCRHPDTIYFNHDAVRSYFQCSRCRLVFVPSHERPGRSEEKARYDLHRNNPYDLGYRQFLSRLAGPLAERLPAGAEGLDFGCGPEPALAMIIRELGYRMTVYDPFYAPDFNAWLRTYDFITATEVFEHLHRPGKELDKLFLALNSGGWLGIMTKLLEEPVEFPEWSYIQDITHVCFYSRATFQYISARWKAELIIIGKDVILLRKEA